MKRWMSVAVLFCVLVVTVSSAWAQVNLLGLERASSEQVGVSKEKLGRIHDVLQENIEMANSPARSFWSHAGASSSTPTPPGFRTRMKANRSPWIPSSASIR
jgi:hypothetical protein